MVVTTFSYKNISYMTKNIVCLYIVSIVLGGFLYYINIEFSYKQDGLVFYHHGLGINFSLLILLSPIVLYGYVKQVKHTKQITQYYYRIKLFIEKDIYEITGYLDTGNFLEDPYFHNPILVINDYIIREKTTFKYIMVPISTINHHQIMRCFFVDQIEIEGVGIRKHVLIGISPKKIEYDGIDALLQSKILEG